MHAHILTNTACEQSTSSSASTTTGSPTTSDEDLEHMEAFLAVMRPAEEAPAVETAPMDSTEVEAAGAAEEAAAADAEAPTEHALPCRRRVAPVRRRSVTRTSISGTSPNATICDPTPSWPPLKPVPAVDCAICLGLLSDTNHCTTVCGHQYHLSCMLEFAATNMVRQPDSDFREWPIHCPLCRQRLHEIPCQIDKELLRLCTQRRWDARSELLSLGAKYSAQIQPDDYTDGSNIGMTALHFAVRDHAPPFIIEEIHIAYPAAIHIGDRWGHTPLDLLARTSPNETIEHRSYTEEEYQQVLQYLDAGKRCS